MSKRLKIRFITVLFFLLYIQPLKAQEDWAKKMMDSLLTVLPKQKEDTLKAMNMTQVSTFKIGSAQHTGNWNDAIEWTLKTLNISLKVNCKWCIGRSYWNLGFCWKEKGNYPEAIKYYSQAVKTSFKNENKLLAVAAYQPIADCYMRMGNYNEVLKISHAGLETLKQMNFPEVSQLTAAKEILSMHIGNAYAKMHNHTEALNWYEKVLAKHRYITEEVIRIQIAAVQIEMKKYDEALKHLLIAGKISPKRLNSKPETDYKGVLGKLYMQIGDVYCKIGSMRKDSAAIQAYGNAINYLNKSLPLLAEGAGGKEALMNAYALLKEACEAVNDYQNALHFTNLYLGIKDSIYSKKNYLKIADLQMQFEREKLTIEQNARIEKIRVGDEVLRQKMIAEQKIKNERQLSIEKLNYEHTIAEEKLQQQTVILNEKIKHEASMAIQKQQQVKLQLEKKRMNNILWIGGITFLMISALLYLLLRQRNLKRRAVERSEAIHKMAELELQSLRTQLNPHFMFNSLNSIQELILLEENEKSHSYLSRFGKLLRMLLDNAEKPFIPLQKEINFLQLYLGLENLRIPDLQYSISSDPLLNAEKTLIPNMILQPYIENAIWHGLVHKEKDKQLQIRIYRENGTVNYEIEDNGVGRKKSAELKSLFRQNHQSKGMELLSKRFKLLNEEYSSDINTSITDVIKNNEVAGTMVVIKVPVKLSEHLLN